MEMTQNTIIQKTEKKTTVVFITQPLFPNEI